MAPSKEGSGIATSAIPPTLPPSVEKAYRHKCIVLRRRMTEVEEQNDVMRQRKTRLERSIRKMRLERVILLECLAKRMKKQGNDVMVAGFYEDSEGSSDESPPTPEERPLRQKRPHRRPAASPPHLASHQTPSGQPGFNSVHNTPNTPVPIQPYPSNGHAQTAPSGSYRSYQSEDAADTYTPGTNGLASHARPLAPKDSFIEWKMQDVAPNGADRAALGSDFQRDCERAWRNLSEEDRASWNSAYEREMREWTRAEDLRKREMSSKRGRPRRESHLDRDAGMMEGVEQASDYREHDG